MPTEFKQDIYRIIAVMAFITGIVAFAWAFSSYNDTLILLYY